MRNIEAVIFDMDGVIFDTERVYLEDWIKVFKRYGYDMKKDIYISVMGTGRKNVKEVFIKEFGKELPIEEMYTIKDKLLVEAVENNKIPLKLGAVELLDFLRNNGYKIALATSAKKDRMEMQLKGANIREKFDALVCGDDVEKSKPNPDIFLNAANKLGVNPKNCIVVEDSCAGIKAAYNAEMIGLHVEDLKEADEVIKKYCYKNFKNLIEIKEFIIKTFRTNYLN